MFRKGKLEKRIEKLEDQLNRAVLDMVTNHTGIHHRLAQLESITKSQQSCLGEFKTIQGDAKRWAACVATGQHEFAYSGRQLNPWKINVGGFRYTPDGDIEHEFKCDKCGLTITKTTQQLTPTERKALQDLGILEKPNGKKG